MDTTKNCQEIKSTITDHTNKYTNYVLQKILEEAHLQNRSYLTEPESKRLLENTGIATTGYEVARSRKAAVEISNSIGYPVVLKIVSPDMIHKSDSGGVKLDLKNPNDVRNAYNDLIHTFYAKQIDGIAVQKMALPGIEAIVGVTRDPIFEHIIMFGLGGEFVEVLKDVSFRILPVSEADIDTMIKEIQGYALLKRHRGVSVDIPALKELILKISNMVSNYPVIKELDLNPILLYESGNMVVDARIFIDKNYNAPSEDSTIPDLHDFFYPRNIAMIGASDNKGKLGWNVFRNLISHNFKGDLYPINPNSETVQGVKAYKNLDELNQSIDVAIVLVSASSTPQAVEDCCKKGIKYIVIESTGFAELGEKGKKAREEMLAILKKYNCRALGPSCSGVINTHHNMVQSLGLVDELGKGNVGLITQAGVYTTGILWDLRHIIDFGIIATIGSKLDIGETDILYHLGNDDNIDVICLQIEDITRGKRFLSAVKNVIRKKPIILLKSGRTDVGKKTKLSHAASLAGEEAVNSFAFKQSGIFRARNNEHMIGLAKGFAKQPLPRTDGVMVITYTGSLGAIAADSLYLNGMRLGKLEEELKKQMQDILPDYVQSLNPLDYSFTMSPSELRKTIEIGAQSMDIGSFIVVIQTENLESFFNELKEIDFKDKPIMTCAPGKEFTLHSVIKMEKAGFPIYSTAEMAAEVLCTMYDYGDKHGFPTQKARHKVA
ncbi:MAG: acetate--CoA ligase family protein [Deltaproteobacteria bacterium]|nr:acetate--CoA ligase family protein [Deltaproteobacteria bacterium]